MGKKKLDPTIDFIYVENIDVEKVRRAFATPPPILYGRSPIAEFAAEEMAKKIDDEIMKEIETKINTPYGKLYKRKLRIRK